MNRVLAKYDMMKYKSTILGMMLAAAGVAVAAPRVQWLNPDYDFGAIAEADGVAQGEFRFVNTGDAPVSVTGVHTSCGCTTAQIPREPVSPGDTAVIAVQYDPTGRPGKFEKKVTVNFSDDVPRTSLRVHGVVIGTTKTLQSRYPIDAGVMRIHSSVIPFGNVRNVAAKSDFLEVYNASHDTIVPVWSNIPPYVSVAPLENKIAPGQQAVYNLMFSGYKAPAYGLVTDSLFIASGPGAEPVKVDVVGIVVEDFSRLSDADHINAPVISVSDDRLDFGTFTPSAAVTKEFTITNKGKNTLILRRVYTADKGIGVSVDKTEIKKGKQAKVTVTVTPEALGDGVLNGRISIISNDPDHSNLTVRAVGLPEGF